MKNKCINLGMLQGDKWDKLHDESRRVYSDEGASPSLVCAGGGNHEIKIAECVGGISENKWGKQYHQQDRVYQGDIALACCADMPGWSYNYMIDEPIIAASRGRNPDNPSDREKGSNLSQRLELGSSEHTNTITTVQKDNYVVMPSKHYRIRKLTERECFKLMGVKQEDFERVAKHQPQSSLYHLAGDSIVTTCLMALFGEMFDVDYKQKINEVVEDITNAQITM